MVFFFFCLFIFIFLCALLLWFCILQRRIHPKWQPPSSLGYVEQWSCAVCTWFIQNTVPLPRPQPYFWYFCLLHLLFLFKTLSAPNEIWKKTFTFTSLLLYTALSWLKACVCVLHEVSVSLHVYLYYSFLCSLLCATIFVLFFREVLFLCLTCIAFFWRWEEIEMSVFLFHCKIDGKCYIILLCSRVVNGSKNTNNLVSFTICFTIAHSPLLTTKTCRNSFPPLSVGESWWEWEEGGKGRAISYLLFFIPILLAMLYYPWMLSSLFAKVVLCCCCCFVFVLILVSFFFFD